MYIKVILVVLVSILSVGHGAENGLARTPPMGWLSWERFRCVTNCVEYPDDCISEWLIRNITDKIVSEGYFDAGYNYVTIDDCWLTRDRDENDNLRADPDRFPSGMKALAAYVHSKGLKFGIYEDVGSKTCAGYPGLQDHYQQDAELLASWDIDYIKVDGCNIDPKEFDTVYPIFGDSLLSTGRDIVYSCEWSLYQWFNNIPINYTAIKQTCNVNRIGGDIDDSYASVRGVVNFVGDNQDHFSEFAGPGYWNDPDMLVIGNFGLSVDQAKLQMSIWCIIAAPLLLSNDVRNTRPEFKEIVLNKDAIAISQDELGIQGRRVYDKDGIQVWTRPITPLVNNFYSFGVAIVSDRSDGSPYLVEISLDDIGLTAPNSYEFKEIFDESSFEITENNTIKVKVNPEGARFFRATPN